MMNTYAHTSITLQALSVRKAELQKEPTQTSDRIRDHWHALMDPPPADTKVQQWVNSAERAVAVYDGVMMGYKLLRRFRGLFSHRKKRR